MKKKITALIFLFTLLATLQVHAAYQLKGSFNSWTDITLVQNPSNSNEYYNENPVYVNGSDESLTWNELCIHNENTYYQSNGSNLEAEKDYSFGTSGNNINTSLENKQAYTFYLDIQKNKVYVKKAYDIVYLKGGMSDWGNKDTYKFSTTDGNEYTLEVASLDANTEFKVFNEVQNEWSGTSNLTISGFAFTSTDNGNIKNTEALSNVKFIYNKSAKTLKVESAADTYKLNIGGTEYEMTTTDNNVYTYTLAADPSLKSNQTITLFKNSSPLYPLHTYVYDGGGVYMTMSETSNSNTMTTGTGNFSGEYTFKYQVDSHQLSIDGAVMTPKEAFLTGEFNSWNTADPAYKFTNQNNENKVFILSNVNLTAGKSFKVYLNQGGYYGYDNAKVSGPVEEEAAEGGARIKLTEDLNNATITFDITDPVNWKLTVENTYTGLAVGFGGYTYAESDNLWNSTDKKYDTYKVTGKGGAKFRIYDSNGKSYGPSMDTDIENGKTYSDLAESANYFVVPNDGREYVLALALSEGKVSMTVTRVPLVGKELAIIGDAVGINPGGDWTYAYANEHGGQLWDSETETYKTWTLQNTSGSDKYFGFYNSSNTQIGPSNSGTELEAGTHTVGKTSHGWKVSGSNKSKYLITVVSFDNSNTAEPQLTIKVEEVKPKVALVTDQIATSNLEWTYENGIKLAAGEQTSVSLTNKELNFRFVDENGTYYYPADNDVTVNDGEYQTNATKTSLDKCYKIAAREGEVIVSVVEFSQGNYVKFAINGIANLYFKANLNSWTMNATTKMTRVDANTFVYRVDNVDVSTLTTDKLGNVLEFGFIADKNGNGTQDDGEWYWAANNENSFSDAGSYERTLYQGGTDRANFWSSVSGNYVFTVTVNNSGVPQKVVIDIDGGEASHKPYYFVGDMNDWFSKEFTDPNAKTGMDKDVMNANKKDWKFTFIDEIPERGELGKGWYEFDIECLTGQFQIFDGTDAMWNGDVYSHDPYVRGYGNNGGKDHDSFKAYINRPISKAMISGGTVMTTTTTKGGNPAIRRSQGSNFHLGCNAVRNAKIYFLPGNDPKLIVSGTPEDYYIFYSKANKTEDTSDGKVTAQIVNGKPNTNNYYLPGVKYDNVALPNYINEDGTTDAHMNMNGVDLVEFDFSADKIATTLASDAFIAMFGGDNEAMIGNVTLAKFKEDLQAATPTLPNGISLTGRTTVYVQKIPNGFEYPAGRKYALQFINAFSSSDKDVLTPVAASNLYFFNDAVHVNFNIDNYEKGAQEKNRYVNMYYRIYTYDENYNTVVIDTDNGTTSQIHSVGEEIGLTAESTTKDRGWVALNEKKAPSDWGGTVADTGYSDLEKWNVAWVSDNRKHIDSKYGNCYIQFKIETGPNASNASAANRANAEEPDHGTLYIPDRALIRNTPEFYTFNGQDLYVALDGGYTTTDVEDVFEDQIVEEGVDAEPIFFNLQGQRVVNPEKGMYIVVKGNKTYKVMIK